MSRNFVFISIKFCAVWMPSIVEDSTGKSRNLPLKITRYSCGKCSHWCQAVSSLTRELDTVEYTNLKKWRGFPSTRAQTRAYITSSFGVVSAIFRQKLKVGKHEKYVWLVDKTNCLKIGQDYRTAISDTTSAHDIISDSSGSLTNTHN